MSWIEHQLNDFSIISSYLYMSTVFWGCSMSMLIPIIRVSTNDVNNNLEILYQKDVLYMYIKEAVGLDRTS